MSYHRRSRPPEKVLKPIAPADLARAKLATARVMVESAGDEADSVVQAAIISALENGITSAEIEASTGYSSEQIERLRGATQEVSPSDSGRRQRGMP